MPSVFLCHASEDKPFVEPIQLALASAGYAVFYDEQSLPPGGDYQDRIHRAINRCDVFVFIATPTSIAPGRFTLTELKFARERWSSPVDRVLPVAIAGCKPSDLPNYLQAATVLAVSGNAAAEVRTAVKGMLGHIHAKRFGRWATVGVLSAAILFGFGAYRHFQGPSPRESASDVPRELAADFNERARIELEAGSVRHKAPQTLGGPDIYEVPITITNVGDKRADVSNVVVETEPRAALVERKEYDHPDKKLLSELVLPTVPPAIAAVSGGIHTYHLSTYLSPSSVGQRIESWRICAQVARTRQCTASVPWRSGAEGAAPKANR